jgi:ectoine hydroxylase
MGTQRAESLAELPAPADPAARWAVDGYLFHEALFSTAELRAMRLGLEEALTSRSERTVLEAGGRTVRSVYGIHTSQSVFSAVARHPRLVEVARAVLGGDVYIYQSKLNTKAVFGGDQWPWHQDYVFWKNEDAMPAPRALTVAVFLDDVTDINGPVSLIPGSHHAGVIDYDTFDGPPPGYEGAPRWISNLTARLKYTLSQPAFVRHAVANGVVTPKGPAGSALFFDCNVAHASPPNLSPYERTLALFTYNRVDNAPPAHALHRPEFLVSRDTRAIVPVDDGVLG